MQLLIPDFRLMEALRVIAQGRDDIGHAKEYLELLEREAANDSGDGSVQISVPVPDSES